MSKTAKKRKKRDHVSKSNHSMNPDRPKGSGGNNMRDKATIKRLQMYKSGKPIRDRKGKIVKAAPFQNRLPSGTVARVEPNRKWFGNTRVISQTALQTFQEEMGKALKDPYKVVMRQTKLPITLLQERAKYKRVHLLDTESFKSTFGPKKKRKRVNLNASDLQDLVNSVEKSTESYSEEKDSNIVQEDDGVRDEAKEIVMTAGQSKRIWGELYKVIDSSDVLLQVLDARDPMGTRSKHIENYLRKEKPHKHLMFVLNKVDLVPTWVTKRWVAVLSSEYPTLAFHASIKNPFGKGALIQLLRQFSKLHCDKKQISVGLIGYPNVGKSSVINTLRSKKVCNVAPIAGETKVWQYITLMKRIYLIDCPGVVYPTGETETETVLKGVVRVENIKTPEDYIPEVLARVKPDYIKRTYRITEWTDSVDFLEKLAARTGKLLKKGEPDISTVAKMVLNDWQRGKIPFFVKPPNCEKGDFKEAIEGKATPQVTSTNDLKDTESSEVTGETSSLVRTDENQPSTSAESSEVTTRTLRRVKQKWGDIRVEPSFTGDDLDNSGNEEDVVSSDEDALEDEEAEGEIGDEDGEMEETVEVKEKVVLKEEAESEDKGGTEEGEEEEENSSDEDEEADEMEVGEGDGGDRKEDENNAKEDGADPVENSESGEEDSSDDDASPSMSKKDAGVKNRGYAPGMKVSFGARAFLNMKNQKKLKEVKRLQVKAKEVKSNVKSVSGKDRKKKFGKKNKGLGSYVSMTDIKDDGEEVPSTSRKARYFDEQKTGESSPKKLTSKQKRRKERDAKPKKVGQHYYPRANIKNRNRNKKAKDQTSASKKKKRTHPTW